MSLHQSLHNKIDYHQLSETIKYHKYRRNKNNFFINYVKAEYIFSPDNGFIAIKIFYLFRFVLLSVFNLLTFLNNYYTLYMHLNHLVF